MHMTITHCKQVLGESHPATLQFLTEMGITYLRRGSLVEGVKVLETVLELEKPYEVSDDRMYRRQALAWGLQALGRYQEAAVNFEMVFLSSLDQYGLVHQDSTNNALYVGRNYELAKELEKALNHYHQYIVKIRAGGNDLEHQACIEKVQGWIREVGVPTTIGTWMAFFE